MGIITQWITAGPFLLRRPLRPHTSIIDCQLFQMILRFEILDRNYQNVQKMPFDLLGFFNWILPLGQFFAGLIIKTNCFKTDVGR